MLKKQNNSILNISLLIIASFIVFYILNIWSGLIIPFIIALLFSFAIIWLSNFYIKIKIPRFISFPLSLLTYILIFYLIWKLIGSNIDEFIRLLPEYQSKIYVIISNFFSLTWLPEPKSLMEVLQKINLQYVFTLAIWWVTSIFSSAWIILFYVMFILLEYRFFQEKIKLMITDDSSRNKILKIIEKIKDDIKSYFVIKTIVSLITAFFSFVIMTSFWLDFAVFWSMLIFLLNFIPSIWSIIAVAFPALFSLVQFWDSYYYSIFLISLLASVQILMWNIIEPRFMWNKLNLSPLVIIIALWFWWKIWWVIWMLLAVPLMVIINIVLSKIPATKPFAILLSEKWDLQVNWWDEVLKTRKKVLSNIKNKIINIKK